MRAAGILLPVFSLPNDYGIGSFGKEAYRFVDFLADCGQRFWQILPLGQTGYGDSPYQCPSAYAGNPYFIDIDTLIETGLLESEEVRHHISHTKYIDYPRLFNERYRILRTAYQRFAPDRAYQEFCDEHGFWLNDYALFMAVKSKNELRSLSEWSAEDRDYILQKSRQQTFESEIGFWKFLQFYFFRQWFALKKYANDKGIKIIGDKPIYTAADSVEVWTSPQYFQVDKDLKPLRIAGCPPDDFDANGQLWGNPLYDWKSLSAENFEWLLKSYDFSVKLYDVVRIDHFRGLISYFSIPANDINAKRGEWIKAPAKEFLSALKKRYHKDQIIAEDLGYMTEDVIKMLKFSGYRGMKVFQFAFYDEDSDHLPKNLTKNGVYYVGTHDNMTTKQWLKSLKRKEKQRLKITVNKNPGENMTFACIRCVLNSQSDIAIISMHDYLTLGKAARINTPSTLGKNWRYRFKKNYAQKLIDKIKAMTNSSGRFKSLLS